MTVSFMVNWRVMIKVFGWYSMKKEHRIGTLQVVKCGLMGKCTYCLGTHEVAFKSASSFLLKLIPFPYDASSPSLSAWP